MVILELELRAKNMYQCLALLTLAFLVTHTDHLPLYL